MEGLNAYTVLRAEEEWQRAGAYSVRIQGMNRQHHISLREEFDGHDGPGTRYVVLLDDEYPVATCRFYEVAPDVAVLGRVVVLPEYRGRGLGARVVAEAEKWMGELGYGHVRIESRLEAVGFYERLGYALADGTRRMSGCFECVEMRKSLERVAGEPVRRGEEEKDPGRMEPPRKAGAGPEARRLKG